MAARPKKILDSEKAHIWVQSSGIICLHGSFKKALRGKRKLWTLTERVLVPSSAEDTNPRQVCLNRPSATPHSLNRIIAQESSRMNSNLFNGQSVHQLFSERQVDIQKRVNAMTSEQLHRDIDLIVAEFQERYSIEIPTLVEGAEFAEEPREDPNSDHFEVVLKFPFTGDAKAFKFRASYSPVVTDDCRAEDGQLSFWLTIPKSSPEVLKSRGNALFHQIAEGLNSLQNEFARYMNNLPNWVTAAVNDRRSKVADDHEARNRLGSIFPIKKREEAAKLITPVKRKMLPISAPKAPSTAEPSNCALEMKAYDDILGTIESMVHVFERSPETFRKMDEENLRMILLVALNGLYEGAATGETFNGDGKTDILIRHHDKNLFIAECLLWKGQAVLNSKMDDQLFKYATWRDSKLALLVFNRNRGFSEVVAKMKETVEAHPQRVRTVTYQHESGARYVFRRADDPQQEFTLTCLAFNVQ